MTAIEEHTCTLGVVVWKKHLLGKALGLGIGTVSNGLRRRANLLAHILDALIDLQSNTMESN